MLSATELISVAAEANRAPSVHNTQPARWKRESENVVLILCDLSRLLPTGDPAGRDAGLSCGAALEGTLMALGERGLTAEVTDLWSDDDRETVPGYRLVARLALRSAGKADPLNAFTNQRFTWRDRFHRADEKRQAELRQWSDQADDVTMVEAENDVSWLAAMNDEVSLAILRDRAYRYELTTWMRFRAADDRYWADGLNLEAMRMDAFTGRMAQLVLGSRFFDTAVSLGLGKALTGEAAKTNSASAIMLFHRPVGESPIETGRHFYRFWLHLTRLGYVAWPMAVLADHPDSATQTTKRFDIDKERRLINVLRCGMAPLNTMRKARLETASLVA